MQKIQRGQLVYVDRPPLTTVAYEHTKPQAYDRLISRIQHPYRVMDLSSHTITIVGTVTPSAVAIDRATPGQNSTQEIDAGNGDHINPSINDAISLTQYGIINETCQICSRSDISR